MLLVYIQSQIRLPSLFSSQPLPSQVSLVLHVSYIVCVSLEAFTFIHQILSLSGKLFFLFIKTFLNSKCLIQSLSDTVTYLLITHLKILLTLPPIHC